MTAISTTSSGYRPDIDGLRALAVLAVVVFHLGARWLPGGFVGVDVFFVISGYLITGLILAEVRQRGTFDFRHFYVRRLRRLGPALLFTLILTTIGTSVLYAPHDLQRHGASLFYAILSLSNFFFWFESGYFDVGSESSALLHTWSLGVEEQFYLVWPTILVTLLLRRGQRAAFIFLVVAVGLSFALNLLFDDRVLSTMLTEVSNEVLEKTKAAMFFLTPFRVFELGLGAGLAFRPTDRLRGRLASEVGFLGGLGLIVYAVLSFDQTTVFPSYNALAPCLGAVLIIDACNPRGSGILLRNRLAVWIGLRSYSLYLIHWPIVVLFRYWTEDEFTAGEQLGMAALALLAAAFMYRFIEQPFRRPQRTRIHTAGNRRFVLANVLVAGLLIILGGSVWAGRGWLWRLSDAQRAVFETISSPETFHEQYYGGVGCRPITRCTVNEGKPTNVYFVGDSHMLQYAAGLGDEFPAIQFTHIDNRCRYNTLALCYAGRWQKSNFIERKARDFALLRQSTDPVVIGQAWYLNTTYRDPATGDEYEFSNMDDYVDFLARHLQEVDRYLGHGRIVVIGEVNRFGRYGDPLTCLGKPLANKDCARSPQSFAPEFNRRLGRKLDAAGIPFVDPTAAVCDAADCINLVDGMPVYSDIGHLSVWGSRLIVTSNRATFARVFGVDDEHEVGGVGD